MNKEFYIKVLGVDNRWHLALPHENVCKCGIKIKTKKFDLSKSTNVFGCYECTY